MYEIWLGANILWEMAVPYALPLLALVVAWLLPWIAALRSPAARWRQGLVRALWGGAAAAVLAFLVLPAATGSSLAQLAYWVDVAVVAAMALGAGAAVAAFLWPLAALLCARRARLAGGRRASANASAGRT